MKGNNLEVSLTEMQNRKWIINVAEDLASFARVDELPQTESALRSAISVIKQELEVREEAIGALPQNVVPLPGLRPASALPDVGALRQREPE